MDGILNINKPAGLTSFAVVSRVKRITGEKHCGHAGTLDPLATGVLLVCLGQATRILEYLFEDNKTYLAEIKLGITTDSYDSSGKLTGQADASGIELKEVEQVLNQFKGCIEQQPPMYSALKHHGQPLYRLARQGIEVERKSRLIQNLPSGVNPLGASALPSGSRMQKRHLYPFAGARYRSGSGLRRDNAKSDQAQSRQFRHRRFHQSGTA
jgi:tRNA pseudouridine(55) synthase